MSALGGAERQLATHVKAAMRHGVAASEIVALREHVSVYAGMRRALKALAVVDHALAEAKVVRQPTLKKVRLADHETIVARAPAISGQLSCWSMRWAGLGVCGKRLWPAWLRGRRIFAYDIRGHGRANPDQLRRPSATTHQRRTGPPAAHALSIACAAPALLHIFLPEPIRFKHRNRLHGVSTKSNLWRRIS
jgi:hypothetical protein